ncbi:MAG: hypothetical protein HGA94_05095, partial [Candidatus Aminicenantes bacterium]|nr:hypothetical protein [Candidatus Aminicenantes bacterium]
MRFRRRSRSVLIVLFSVLGLSGALASLGATAGQAPPAGPGASLPLAFVTYVHQPYQESAARALIECIRTWGGDYRGSPIYVVVTDPGYLTRGLEDKTVMRVPLEVGEPVRSFPYAVKARAAAAVEGLVAGKVRSLAWFDPETLLFGPPREMDLGDGIAAAGTISVMNSSGRRGGEGNRGRSSAFGVTIRSRPVGVRPTGDLQDQKLTRERAHGRN